MPTITRRAVLLGLGALPGCSTLSALNDAATPRDTYALQPVNVTGRGRRINRTLLVVEPSADAALATDRILIKPDALSVTYLPGARWADELPRMMSSVLIQSLSNSGQIGFVGAQGEGPIPDVVLLTRIDRFGVTVQPSGALVAQISLQLTILRDQDQRILATRRFTVDGVAPNDSAVIVARTFQALLEQVLPDVVGWVTANI